MAYDETKLTRLAHLKALATKVNTITDDLQDQIDSLDGGAIKTVKVNGTALVATENAVDVLVTCAALATPTTGYAASYQVKANGIAVGDTINIPKDFLVKSATMETCQTVDVPIAGLNVGDPYLDFVVNTVDSSETAQHIYINVKGLVDVYTAGNGIAIANNVVSAVVDSTNANGLAVGASGLSMGLATDSAAGAMSAADHAQMTADHTQLGTNTTKLAGISAEANKVTVTTEKAGTIEIDGVSKTIVEMATDAEVTEMLTEVFGA